MPRVCTVCSHPQREAIDRAIIAGEALRRIAPRISVDEASLRRHRDRHMAQLVQDHQEHEAARASSLLDQLRSLQSSTLGILDGALGSSDHGLALRAIREARSNVELLARLTGELEAPGVQVQLVMSPEWLRVRVALLEALQPFPEARGAVSGALLQLEATG